MVNALTPLVGSQEGHPGRKGSDTLESFLSKVAVKVTCERKLASIEHVLIVKVNSERRKIEKVFMTHVQDSFPKITFDSCFQKKTF